MLSDEYLSVLTCKQIQLTFGKLEQQIQSLEKKRILVVKSCYKNDQVFDNQQS